MSLSLFALTDKVAIVTGAGRGIGKAVALGLAEAGANVVVAARTVSDIENTATEISALGRKTLWLCPPMCASANRWTTWYREPRKNLAGLIYW